MKDIQLLYQHLYATERWKKVRVWMLQQAGYRCRECGTRKDVECVHTMPMDALIESLQRKGQGKGNRMDAWQVEQLFFDLYRLHILCKACQRNRARIPPSMLLAEQERAGII